jgi:hypothetical protein
MWTSSEDAIPKCPEADGRIMVCVGPIVKVDVQQRNAIPYRRRNSSDQQEDRSCEEEEDTDPKSRGVSEKGQIESMFLLTSEFC